MQRIIMDLEGTLLCEILLDKAQNIESVRQIITSEKSFGNPRYSKLYEAICLIAETHGECDNVALGHHLESLERKDELLAMIDVLPLTYENSNLLNEMIYHAKLIEQEAIVRDLQRVRMESQVQDGILSDPMDGIDAMDIALKELKDRMKNNRTRSIADGLVSVQEKLERVMSHGGVWGDKQFYFTIIDQKTGGIEDGELVILAAREKSGKSTFLFQVALANAKARVPVLIFSNEMSVSECAGRMIGIEMKTNLTDHQFGEEEHAEFLKVKANLFSLPIEVREASSLEQIESQTKIATSRTHQPIGLVIVDYLQIISARANRSNDNREQQISDISRSLKLLARQCSIPIIAASQVNEDGRTRESRAPEQDADIIIFLDKDKGDYKTTMLTELNYKPTGIRIRQRLAASTDWGDEGMYLMWDRLSGSFRNFF